MRKILLNLHENFWNEYFNHKFWILFFIICGISLYFNLSYEPKLDFVFITLFISFLSVLITKYFQIEKRNTFIEYIFYLNICLLSFSFGIFIAKIDTERHKKNLIHKEIILKDVKARVQTIQFYKKQNKSCFKIKNFSNENLRKYSNSKIKNTFLKICSFDKNAKKIKIGDNIIFYGVKLTPFPYPFFANDFQFARNSYFENLIGIGVAKFVIKNIDLKNKKTLFEKINQWRFNFSEHLSEKFGDDVGGIISAITIGDRSYVSDEISDNMKRSSIFHLIAISGLHISFVSLFFTFILTRFFILFSDKYCNYFKMKKIIYFLSLLFATFYLLISGISLSAQRAFLMFLILNIYVYSETQVNTRNIVFWVVLIILITQPHSLLNPGLQMSILAVTSLVFFNFNDYCSACHNFKMSHKNDRINLIENVPRGTFCMKIILSVLVPHLAIIPITLFYFQNTSTYSIVANIIAIPLTTFIIMPLIILNFFLEMFHVEQINSLLEYCLKISIKFLLKIGDFFANLPGGYIKIHQISVISFSLMILGLVWFFIWHKNWRFYGLFLYFIGLTLVSYNNFPNLFIYKNKNQIKFILNDDNNFYGYFLDKEDLISKKISIKTKNVPRGTFSFEIKNKKIFLCKSECDTQFINLNKKVDLVIILREKENVPRGTFSYPVNKKVKNETECSTWNILYINSKKIDENGTYSIFIKSNGFIVKTGLDYIGNRPWNFNYKND
jgi:competence protein ComEC